MLVLISRKLYLLLTSSKHPVLLSKCCYDEIEQTCNLFVSFILTFLLILERTEISNRTLKF